MDLPTDGAGPARPGRAPARPESDPAGRSFDVADAIGEFVAILGARAPVLALVCQLSSAPLRVRGDQQRCVQALLELAQPSTARADVRELHIAAAVAGEHVEIEIAGAVPGGNAGACPVQTLRLPRAGADDCGESD